MAGPSGQKLIDLKTCQMSLKNATAELEKEKKEVMKETTLASGARKLTS